MPIDFGLPTTTDAYAGVPTTHRNHQVALAQMLDPSYAGTITAAPTGAKRLNSSNGLAEMFNGTSWVEWGAAWLKKSGGTMTGDLALSAGSVLRNATPAVDAAWLSTAAYATGQGDNATHFGYRTSGGAYVNYIRGAATYFAADARVAGDLYADSGLVVAGTGPGGYGIDTSVSSRIANILRTGFNSSEALRAVHDSAYLSFFNGADTARSGYLQCVASGQMILANETGADILFNTSATTRWVMSPSVFYPATNNSTDIGQSSVRLRNLYAVLGDYAGLISSSSAEALRINHSSGVISGYNTAGTVRTGILQFGAGGSVALGAENGADVAIYVGGTLRQRATTAGRSEFTGAALTNIVSVTYAASLTIDAATGNAFKVGNLTGNVTSMAISNGVEGQFVSIRFRQDATGGRTVALPSGAKVNGSIAGGANRTSYLNLTYNATDSRWEGNWSQIPA